MAEDTPINWAYPFPCRGADVDPLRYLTNMAKAKSGYYPTGDNGLWHGGVHFDEGTADVFDQSSVRCIADGEVIAYRIDENYPLSEFIDEVPRIKRAPFSTGFVLVRHRLRLPPLDDPAGPASEPPALTLYSLYMHLQDWAGYRAKPELPRPAFWAGDTYSVDTRGDDLIVRSQPSRSGAEVTRLAKGTQVRVEPPAGEYCKLVAVLGGSPAPVAGEGGELPGYLAFKYLKALNEPQALDQVVVLEQGIPIKAGELVGYPGLYQNHNSTAQPLLHLEVFSCDDVPGFIGKSRAWASRLPDSQKTLLKVYKGASKLIAHRDDISPDNPPKLSDSGSQIGVDLIIPQALLDGLPAASKIQVKTPGEGSTTNTTHWWRLGGLFADENDNPIDGWLAEQDLITTRHSPWEWLDFQWVKDTGTPLEKLAYSLNAKGLLDTDERHNYRAQISKADGGPIMSLARLYEIVDNDKDSVLTGNEMRAALKKPWQAQVLGQLITRYESEWFWNKAKWDELDRLLADEGGQENAVWEVEKKRIEKLSWWGELAGKHGVDEEGKAWHFQAVSLVGSFIKVGRINITIEMLKRVFEGLQDTDEADELLGEIASQINANCEKYKLDTALRLSHFFSQVRQEIGSKCRVVEDFTYSPEGLKGTFRYFRLNPEEASTYGYAGRSRFVSVENQMAIANRAYASRYDNGDIASGDGWRYRGRGLKHLTFKSNYSDFKIYHKGFWGEDVDFVQSPDLLHEDYKYVVRSGIYFWMSNSLFVEADKGADGSVVDAITRIINEATDSYGKRRENFKRIFEVEEVFKDV
ncbi:glycoside hydrolase family 19 protein [Stutzerimonas nitrititolerans]|uniref:glycoside hydrolase family 19 protein n=1 Tax=Stutzerimonas nitrititolerans TaxID=2482751 RepID=UPI003F7D8A2D